MSPRATDTATLLRGMYEAEAQYLAAGGPGRASFDALGEFFAPDVELHEAASLPFGGSWRGHGGMQAFMTAMAETWEAFEFVDQRFLATRDDMAVVLTQVHARARHTGAELDFPILQTLAVRDGRITEVRPFYWDTAAIVAATSRR